MKSPLFNAFALGITATLALGAPPEAKVARKPLPQKVLLSDLITVAEVKAVKVVHSTETFEYQQVTCVPKDVLKGRTKQKEFEVTLSFNPKAEPSPIRLQPGQTYVLFLNGTWSYQPLAPPDGILPVAQQYMGPNGKKLDHNEFLAEIRKLVKNGPRIREVSITVNTAGGWGADFRVHSGGKTGGGHMSGGERPFHHMEEGELSGEPLKTILAQAEKVYNSDVPSQPVIKTNNLVCIQIEMFSGESKVYQRKIKEAFPDKDLVELDRLLHKHRIGAW